MSMFLTPGLGTYLGKKLSAATKPNRPAVGATGGIAPKTNINGYDVAQIPTMSPETMQFFQSILGKVQPGAESAINRLSALAGGEESAFAPMEKYAQSQFQERLGDISSRFSGAGLGGRHGSAFQNAVSGAGADLAERLASQRLSYQQQAQNQLLELAHALMGQRTHETALFPEEKPWWQKLLGSTAPIIGTAGGAALGALGGPGGALAGAKLGSQVGSAFGRSLLG
ncbi:MAG TPA: hypothetical protein VFX43_09425 [Chitinophagaceae bacterium]|nr:hypothetical protein [Chitinophagaceae bacterium]